MDDGDRSQVNRSINGGIKISTGHPVLKCLFVGPLRRRQIGKAVADEVRAEFVDGNLRIAAPDEDDRYSPRARGLLPHGVMPAFAGMTPGLMAGMVTNGEAAP